jgi:hypothetical protein
MRSFHFARLNVAFAVTLLVILFSAPSFLRAQDSSSMSGVVTDATGAVIPNATVTLSNKSTGLSYTQTTNQDGDYHFASVSPGEGYTAVFSHEGFASVELDNLVLSVGVTRTQNEKLQAGATAVVEVSAANQGVTLNTTDASIGNNIDVELLNAVPIQDRTNGVTTLFNLQPGVDNTQLGGSGSVTGARTDQSSVTVDGLDVNDIASNATFAIISTAPVDSVEQFTGTVAGLNPSLGTGAGGQFQLVTRAGTNKFHGNINEYHRDTTTVANTYFNNNDGLPRTPLIRNQFGGNIGGPILKDKLFFFVNVSDSRIIQSQTVEQTVPLSNLTGATPTLNNINNGAGCSDSSRINTQPTCISSLTAAQVAALDPLGQGFDTNVLSFLSTRYPAANDLTQGDGVNTGGFRFTSPAPDISSTYVARVDYNFTPTQKIFGRMTLDRLNEVYPTSAGAPQFPGDPDGLQEVNRSYSYVVSHVWTGKTKVNQFYYGDTISKLDFPVGDFPTSPNIFTFSGLTNPYGTSNSQDRRVPIPVVRDDFNWQLGRHSLVAGGLFKFIKTNSNSIGDYNTVGGGLSGALSSGLNPSLRPSDIYTSSTATALNDYDNLFTTTLGIIGSISSNFNYTKTGAAVPQGSGGPRAYRYFETEAYVGDTWKVNQHLTLSYGLRYQLYSVPYEVHGEESVSEMIGSTQRQSTFNAYFNQRLAQNAAGVYGPTTLPLFQEILGGKANNGPSSYAPSYKDFAPRFAFSYSPAFSPKTVFSGSAGIVYDRTVINVINFLQDQLSFLFYNGVNNNFPLGGATSANDALLNDPRFGAKLAFSSSLNPVPQPITAPYIPYVSGGQPYGLAAGQTGFVIDPGLRDPYSIELNAGIQQALPDHMILRVNYAGRLGRRLVADADASQVLNFPDNASGQTLSQAFSYITTQVRAGADPTTPTGYTAQPFFEDLLPAGLGVSQGLANNTSFVAAALGQYVNRGDIADTIFLLANAGLWPDNVGIPAQFGTQAYLTNKSSSNYHALLLTLNKNLSQGIRFDFNYTFSHSIDNSSLSSANNALYNITGIICDVTKPRACRARSDFDVRQEISSDVTYELPFGRGKAFFGNAPLGVEEAIGGWSLSGLPAYRTGLADNPLSDAFLASFDSEDPAIFTGNKSDLKVHVNNVAGTVFAFPGGQTGANKVLNEFRGPIGLEYGQRNIVNGPGAFSLDMGLQKIFPIIPKKNLNLTFRADAFNIFNHPIFSNQGVNIVSNSSQYGQITGTTGEGPRVAQFSLRLEF